MTTLMEAPNTDRLRAADPHPGPDRRPDRLPDRRRPREHGRAPVPMWRRVVPALAIAVIAMAYVYATVPFTFAGVVECRQHGFSGAAPAPGTPAGAIIGDIDLRCSEAGSSRMAMAGVTGVLAAVVGVAGALAPTDAEVRARRLEQAPRRSSPATAPRIAAAASQ